MKFPSSTVLPDCVVRKLPMRVRRLLAKGSVFFDHHMRPYTITGGIGNTWTRGTYARVWIKSHNRIGHSTITRDIRFDLYTAQEFYTELGTAIKAAEDAHRRDRISTGEYRI